MAAQLPGSRQVGLARRLLAPYEWWRCAPHPECVADPATPERWQRPIAAGIPGQVRVVYLPSGVWGLEVRGVEANRACRARLFDPVTGEETDLGLAPAGLPGLGGRPHLGARPRIQDVGRAVNIAVGWSPAVVDCDSHR